VIAGALAAAPSQGYERRGPAPIVARLAMKEVLSGDDLVALAAQVEAGNSADLTALVGKPFSVVVTPDQSSAEGPRWWYDDLQQALGLHAPIGPLSGEFFTLRGCAAGATARGIQIARAEVNRRLVGQTPDGARQMIDERRQYRVSLGGLECGAPAAPSGLNASLGESRKTANSQIPTLRTTIQGTLQLVDGRALLVCGGERTTPTTETPTELVIHQCVIGAVIRRIAFTANGGEVATWSTADRPPPVVEHRPWIAVPPLQDFH